MVKLVPCALVFTAYLERELFTTLLVSELQPHLVLEALHILHLLRFQLQQLIH